MSKKFQKCQKIVTLQKIQQLNQKLAVIPHRSPRQKAPKNEK